MGTSTSRFAWVILFVAVWQGMIGVFVKWIPWPPLALVSLRCVVASAVLWGLVALRRKGGRAAKERRASVSSLLLGGALLAGHWGALFAAYRLGDIGPVVVAVFTYPVITSLMEPLVNKKPPNIRQLVTALVSSLGVACVAFARVGEESGGDGNGVAIACALASAFLFAVRNIQARRLMVRTDAISLMAWQVSVAALVLAPFLLQVSAEHWSPDQLALICVVGVFFTALPHTLTVWALKGLSAAAVGIIGSLQVVSGIVCAAVFLGEEPGVGVWLGAAFVIGAVGWETVVHLSGHRFHGKASSRSE